jgi:hypothetical protein
VADAALVEDARPVEHAPHVEEGEVPRGTTPAGGGSALVQQLLELEESAVRARQELAEHQAAAEQARAHAESQAEELLRTSEELTSDLTEAQTALGREREARESLEEQVSTLERTAREAAEALEHERTRRMDNEQRLRALVESVDIERRAAEERRSLETRLRPDADQGALERERASLEAAQQLAEERATKAEQALARLRAERQLPERAGDTSPRDMPEPVAEAEHLGENGRSEPGQEGTAEPAPDEAPFTFRSTGESTVAPGRRARRGMLRRSCPFIDEPGTCSTCQRELPAHTPDRSSYLQRGLGDPGALASLTLASGQAAGSVAAGAPVVPGGRSRQGRPQTVIHE